jgi:hypothetical protein
MNCRHKNPDRIPIYLLFLLLENQLGAVLFSINVIFFGEKNRMVDLFA